MSKIIEIINSIFNKSDDLALNDRFEFRLSSKEKILINKYCKLRNISASKFFRELAMKEIDNFINVSNK